MAGMASTTGDLRNPEIKLLKADGPQFVQRNDKLQGTKVVEPNNATSPHEGTKAVEPNNATSPHEVEVPSLDRLDLNENSNGAIEDFSDDLTYFVYAQGPKEDLRLYVMRPGAWLRKLLYGEGKRRGTMKWKRLVPPSDADLSSLRESLIDPPGEAV